jgi:hypothetical protein
MLGNMVNVRDPAGVGSEGGGTTSPQSHAAIGTEVLAAARALEDGSIGPTAAQQRLSAQVMVGGGLFVAFLVVLVVSVIWVSDKSKHPLVQQISPSPTTTAPTSRPTATAGPIPLPATTTQRPLPVDTPAVEVMPPAQVTAETITPAPTPPPPPPPLRRRLHELFPRLFPNG